MTQALDIQHGATQSVERRARTLTPPVDIYENEEELLLLADLPGVEPGAVRVSLDPPELRIEAELKRSDGEPVVFRRAFRTDERIDPDGISAVLSAGVLRVHLKKSAALRPRRIEVSSG